MRLVRRTLRRLLEIVGRRSLGATLARQRNYWPAGPTFVLSFDVETERDCSVLPTLAARLSALSLPASFACIGTLVARFPAEHKELLDQGFELINHSESHPWHVELGNSQRFDLLDDTEIDREIRQAADRLEVLGARPQGFRTPHFGAQHTRRVYPALRRVGLKYSTSTLGGKTSGGAPFQVEGIWEFPLVACPEHPRTTLDSWHCTRAPDAAHRSGVDVLRVHREVISLVEHRAAFGSLYWDPADVDHRYDAVLELLSARAGAVRFTTYGQILKELA